MRDKWKLARRVKLGSALLGLRARAVLIKERLSVSHRRRSPMQIGRSLMRVRAMSGAPGAPISEGAFGNQCRRLRAKAVVAAHFKSQPLLNHMARR
jgi:hypothetical protein